MACRILRLLLIGLVWWPSAPAEARSVSQAFKKVSDSVVVILTKQLQVTGDTPHIRPGLGSGVVISHEGEILTAAHLVQTADEIGVRFTNGEVVLAHVVTSEPSADIAMLRLTHAPQHKLSVALLGDSDKVEVGDEVFVVGAPLGISHTLTVGHISSRRRPIALLGGMELEFFQTDAAINQGNSGGPMFNMQGEVIGIVSHLASQTGGNQGLGFAVTSNLARELLLEGQAFWSGMTGHRLAGPITKAFNLPQSAGLLVEEVAAGSPAERVGLRPGTIPAVIDGISMRLGGDIILAVDDIRVGGRNSYQRIRKRLAKAKPGETVALEVLREGRLITMFMVR